MPPIFDVVPSVDGTAVTQEPLTQNLLLPPLPPHRHYCGCDDEQELEAKERTLHANAAPRSTHQPMLLLWEDMSSIPEFVRFSEWVRGAGNTNLSSAPKFLLGVTCANAIVAIIVGFLDIHTFGNLSMLLEGMHAIVTLFAWTLWLESPSEELIFLVRFNGCFPSAICIPDNDNVVVYSTIPRCNRSYSFGRHYDTSHNGNYYEYAPHPRGHTMGYLNATRVIKREAIYALVAALYSGVNLFVTWYSWINNYADLCDALHSMPREGHDNDAISSTPIRERGFFPSFWVKDRVCTWPLEDPRLTAVLADDFQVLNSTSSQLGLLSLYNAEQYDVARMVGVILELEAVPMLLLASMVYTKCLHIDFAEDLQDFNFTASETFSLGLFGLRFILSFALSSFVSSSTFNSHSISRHYKMLNGLYLFTWILNLSWCCAINHLLSERASKQEKAVLRRRLLRHQYSSESQYRETSLHGLRNDGGGALPMPFAGQLEENTQKEEDELEEQGGGGKEEWPALGNKRRSKENTQRLVDIRPQSSARTDDHNLSPHLYRRISPRKAWNSLATSSRTLITRFRARTVSCTSSDYTNNGVFSARLTVSSRRSITKTSSANERETGLDGNEKRSFFQQMYRRIFRSRNRS